MPNIKLASKMLRSGDPIYQVGHIVTTKEPGNGPMRITDCWPVVNGWAYSVDTVAESADSEYAERDLIAWHAGGPVMMTDEMFCGE